jgi:hypothetical protein
LRNREAGERGLALKVERSVAGFSPFREGEIAADD